jgi:hypothetical protein
MAIINREYIDGEFNDVSNFPFRPSNSGSLAIFAAIRRASSFLTLIKVLIDPLWINQHRT